MGRGMPGAIRNAASKLLRRVVEARPGEGAALLFGFAYFFCLLCGYYLLRPLRDAMGLVGGVGKLQWLFSATFIAMLALTPLFGWIATRWPPRRFVPLVYRFFALNILVFGALFALRLSEVTVSRVFFVWISVFNLFVVSVFWSVMADRFRNEQSKRLFGFIAAGGTAGALLGPALAALLAPRFGIAALTLLAAAMLELAVQCYRGLMRTGAAAQAAPARRIEQAGIGGGMLDGIRLVARERYLLGIVLYLLLHAFASTLLYLEQGRIVAASFADTAERTRYFAAIDFAVSALTLVSQLAFTGRMLQRFGVAAALLLLPLAGLLSLALLSIWPSAAALALAQALRRAVDYAIARPARETLFTVVDRAAKYKAKNLIDTVVYRGGDAFSGWIFSSLAAAGLGFGAMTLAFVPFTGAWIRLSLWLARRQQEHERARMIETVEKES
jgi:AAA family ATP:ADP antiporter